MAKKDKKADKADKNKDPARSREPADVVEAVRGAVERTFQATTGSTEGARDRGRSLLDDVASAAQRIRESFDDLRVLEDVRGLRTEIEVLSKRVAELEKQQAAAAKPAPTRRAPATRKPAAAKVPAKAPAKAPAKSSAKAAAKPSAAGTAAKTTGPKPKPATGGRKPAASRTPAAGGS